MVPDHLQQTDRPNQVYLDALDDMEYQLIEKERSARSILGCSMTRENLWKCIDCAGGDNRLGAGLVELLLSLRGAETKMGKEEAIDLRFLAIIKQTRTRLTALGDGTLSPKE